MESFAIQSQHESNKPSRDETCSIIGDDTVHDHPAACTKTPKRQRFFKVGSRFLLRFFLLFILAPGLFAGLGAIVDRRIFGTQNSHFHTTFFPCSAFVAGTPAIVRWTYSSSGGQHVKAMEFAIYVIQTGGIVGAYRSALVGGKETFDTIKHIRQFFAIGDQFFRITSPETLYSWLFGVVTKVYNTSQPRSHNGGRMVAGRLAMVSPIRLRQNRVKAEKCAPSVGFFHLSGFKKCFMKFSSENEDRAPYSVMKFNWTNLPYKTFSGFAKMDEIYTTTEQNRYPFAGYWTFFPPTVSFKLVHSQLQAMRRAKWIDKQTRLIAMDFSFILPEFSPPLWGIAEFAVEVSQAGQFLPQRPDIIINLLPEQSSDKLGFEAENDTNAFYQELIYAVADGEYGSGTPIDTGGHDNGKCSELTGKEYFIPFYFGMFSVALYTMYIHLMKVRTNWRDYFSSFFTYTEIVWVIVLVLSVVFRLRADRWTPCTFSVTIQTPFVSAVTEEDVIRSAVFSRFELSMMGVWWQEARRFLGLALFLHLFNFLKFFTRFSRLGWLVRTLQSAASGLASFSLSFAVVFVAFVTMFYTLFSLQEEGYSTFLRSTTTLWLGMLGDISMTSELWAVKEWAVPLIIFFSFLSVFVLLTLIIAIISDAHERVKQDNQCTLCEFQLLQDLKESVFTRVHPLASVRTFRMSNSRAASSVADLEILHSDQKTPSSLIPSLTMTSFTLSTSSSTSTENLVSENL